MRTIFWWLLSLMLALTAPLAWGESLPAHHTMHHPLEANQATSAPAALPCPMHSAQAPATASPTPPDQSDTPASGAHHHRQPCGDCSACHVVALLPPLWLPPRGPDKVDVTPTWHPDLGAGRPETCELYRPPRA